ncbi:MAG: gliding motility-associated C-terminal domain-containing protein [Flavobacteriales bacterium]|nr:gliding motility-associated C-terminal domain-containing protein [Flavobacteriales bacterium]
MQRSIFCTFLFFTLVHLCSAQSIGRQVISPLSFSAQNNGAYLSQTLGQIEFTTQENEQILTQGFQQASDLSSEVEISILYPECLNEESLFLVNITSLGSCFLNDVSFSWNGLEGGESFTIAANELLELSVSSTQGCETTILVDTSVPSDLQPCFGDPYNLITPNGDGENDTWTAEQLPPDDYAFRVWNRWGDVMFETANFDVDLGWDGSTSNGEQLPVGAYFYELKGSKHAFSGEINLLR